MDNVLEDTLQLRLPPEDFPSVDDVVLITRFAEAVEILRSTQMKPGQGTRSIRVVIDPAGNVQFAGDAVGWQVMADSSADAEGVFWVDLFRSGALQNIHGKIHTQRRRALNPLFGRDAHLWFRDKVILPGVARNLRKVLESPDADGAVRTDIVVFAKRVFIQAAAALVGFDRAQTDAGADELIEIHAQIENSRGFTRLLPLGEELRDHMQQAFDGRTQLFERFYAPSLEARRQLVDRHRAGELADTELPHDLLTLIAGGAATFDVPQIGFSMAMSFINGATGTNTNALAHGLTRLAEWFALHPSDLEWRLDPTFLEGAVRETIRLVGNGQQALSRVALADVALSSGRVIRAGQHVALILGSINRDTSVFGADAATFNPRRVVPVGVYDFGLGFGSGSHMCMGLPLVLGQGGITGMQVPVLQALCAAGIRPDPARPAEKQVGLMPFRDEYASFPVIFAPDG